ncbi:MULTISPECIES: serine/threonine-protein kinase [unclassified Oceanispirochaeta]|uniref:serine/threonine-protein kinase n=1 Tax=unclassified Oceanispirochaeta TaxID=2635722 RepID=UPI000E090F37|nr:MULTISPECIES: serine/threonine-protein kinase [unclassified Oceanispirochaeta]MBF9017186.1 serine/threonine protein kinase [Oceanispirochaeta sp. M2]NPD73635.1 serine/threonine protein kinase [Oceanispirochaeta sp. M1]RDG30565.1 serine/threonine protein kinase [Oceanispirochaeta sp. M1]
MTIPEINDENGNIYEDFTFFKKGGMGEIYKGKEKKSGKDIVIKLVFIDLPDYESLLKTELDISEKFSHMNVVSSLKSGKIEIDGNDYLFMIQDYFENGNLRPLINEKTSIDRCFDMFFDILNGMREIHKYIVHRDLKPENILVDSNNSLLITDFGLAKYIDEKTRTRSFKGGGTIPYMSPECWTGDSNTLLMDIYSLGIIFFEIVTGHLPYNANTELEWRECHLFTPFPSISKNRNGNLIKLDQIIQKMSNKRPNQRYKTIDEIIDAINSAKSIHQTDENDTERLAQLGNIALQKSKAIELKTQQEAEKKKEWIKFINFEISELLNQFKNKVNSINERLEDGKLTIKEQSYNELSTTRKMTISFGNKSIQIEFMNNEAIERNDKEQKERSIEFQKQRNQGFIMQKPKDSFFIEKNIIQIGLAETSFKIGDNEFGFNLILQKIDGSNYGEWKMIQFSENITPPKTKFGIDLSNFFELFNKVHHSMFHTTTIKEIEDKDINSLIEKILI